MSEHRKVPQGRIGRFARLAAVGMRTGAGMLLDRDGSSTAQRAAEVLGTLRGLAAKVGQMASYVDGIVPDHHQDAFQTSLKVLRAAAPKSKPAEVRLVVEEDLGGPIDQLFTEWDDDPLASASIGQVHRARTKDGREVAVKVQHPGVAEAVEADLSNASIIEGMSSAMGMRRFDVKSMLAVVRQRFREELDYELEADNVRYFAKVHEGDPKIRIPALVPEACGKRVLTTELVRGKDFDQACEAPERERAEWARTMWRYVFKGNLVGGKFNADPHPGNYIFHDDGVVTFLDYGCVNPIPQPRLDRARRIHWAALDRDLPRFYEAVSAMLDAKKGRLEDLARDYTRRCFEPLFDSPYRVKKEYAAALVEEMKDMAKVAKSVDEDEFFTMPADMVFINRLQFGFYSVLARLDVEVDYAEIERTFVPRVASDS
jgi:predicted unusual protein kinase regulating ubiquinone biosynthesis (AarF/ABC1/UbiB family)